MPVTAFDHVNIRTSNLDAMIAWYGDILGLVPGRRPEFGFPGAWLYLGDRAIIHLVGAKINPEVASELTLEHFALRATGLNDFLKHLMDRGIRHSIDPVPGIPVVQVNLHDPDGNHIHVDFSAVEHTTQ